MGAPMDNMGVGGAEAPPAPTLDPPLPALVALHASVGDAFTIFLATFLHPDAARGYKLQM